MVNQSMKIESLADLVTYSSPLNSRNRCIDMCMLVLNLLDIPKDKHHLYMRYCRIDKDGVIEEHHWIHVNGNNYDFTASQYKDTVMPLIWDGDNKHPNIPHAHIHPYNKG